MLTVPRNLRVPLSVAAGGSLGLVEAVEVLMELAKIWGEAEVS